MRKTIFTTGEHYHIFNRGVDKRDIFSDAKDYERFLISMNLLNNQNDGAMIEWRDFSKNNSNAIFEDFLKLSFRIDKLVEIAAYCLNPNHYHFILKQLSDKGIAKFMHKIGTSHTKYYNDKFERNGSLFQGPYKATLIDSNEYLLYLSVYVNNNNFIHGYNLEKKKEWEYSSLLEYLGKRNNEIVKKEIVLDQFKSIDDYKYFMNKNSTHMKNKKETQKYPIEE